MADADGDGGAPDAAAAGAGAADAGGAYCPTCAAAVDEVDEFAGEMMCAACGTVLEGAESALVSSVRRPFAGDGPGDAPAEGYGVAVALDDSGALACARAGGVCVLR
jgi:hypothetical protein